MYDKTSLKDTDLGAHMAALTELPRTESVKFVNQTTNWTVQYWLYEFRQTTNLPPKPGFEPYTGIVVGGQDVRPGQEQVAMVQMKIQANFSDCGAWKLRASNGQTMETLNFADQIAPAGKFFLRTTFTMVNRTAFGENAVGWEVTHLMSDGTVQKDEGVILSTLNA